MIRTDETPPFHALRIAVLTVSDTRTRRDDASGNLLVELLIGDGHELAERAIVSDDAQKIEERLLAWARRDDVDVVVTTGGTGLTGRDVTPEALVRIADKEIPGFGELFRMLSYESIGTSTVQSRATACLVSGTYIFALPGSRGAVRDGWTKILHYQLDSRTRPCNFVELIPRLKEGQS